MQSFVILSPIILLILCFGLCFLGKRMGESRGVIWFRRNFWIIFSVVVSSSSLLFTAFRCNPIRANWSEITMDVLAILVTLLVGWNIYSALDIKREFEQFKKKEKAKLQQTQIELGQLLRESETTIYKSVGIELSEMKQRMDKGEALLQANIALSMATSLKSNSVEKEYLFISQSIKAVTLWANLKEYANANSGIFFLFKTLKPEEVLMRKSQLKIIYKLVEQIPNQSEIEQMDCLNNFVSRIKTK